MTAASDEIRRRKDVALTAIRNTFSSEQDEYGASLFVSHHLEELDESYWLKHLGTTQPAPHRVLDILVLRSHWSDKEEDGIDTFDFTLLEVIANLSRGRRSPV